MKKKCLINRKNGRKHTIILKLRRIDMADNILNGDRNTLQKIYEEVKDLSQSEIRERELTAAEDSTENVLEEREKAIAKEAADTIKKRREEIISTFDIEEDKLNAIAKKTNARKPKHPNPLVSSGFSFITCLVIIFFIISSVISLIFILL